MTSFLMNLLRRSGASSGVSVEVVETRPSEKLYGCQRTFRREVRRNRQRFDSLLDQSDASESEARANLGGKSSEHESTDDFCPV